MTFTIYGQRWWFARIWGVVGEAETVEEAALLFPGLWHSDHHRLELWRNGKPDKKATLRAYELAAASNPVRYCIPPKYLFEAIWRTNRADHPK